VKRTRTPRGKATVRARPLILFLILIGFADPAQADLKPVLDSAIGTFPGHWSLTTQGFRDRYVPDEGFGNGAYAVPRLDAPVVLGFDLDSIACSTCKLMPRGERSAPGVSRYQCEAGLQGRRIFFMESGERVLGSDDVAWIESKAPNPPFKVSGDHRGRLFFHEWVSSREIAPGQKLACGAWIEGDYPPKGEYSEEYEDTLAIGEYVIRDRAIYLTGKDKVVYLFQDHTPVESSAATFESAFLPTRYSDLENVSLSYIYRIPGGFWLRINLVRNHEGAGAYQGMFILEFKDGNGRLLAGNSELYMY